MGAVVKSDLDIAIGDLDIGGAVSSRLQFIGDVGSALEKCGSSGA